jgi:hypothetical protein
MHVLVLDPALIPISIDVVIGDNVYELHFKVELKDMQENPKPLEMDENGDDTNGKEDENGNEQLDFMQEDSEHNSKEKCADQGFANKQMGKRVGGGGDTIISPTDIMLLIACMSWKITCGGNGH